MRWVTAAIVLSLVLSACASSDKAPDSRLASQYVLPNPGIGQGGPAYPTEAENDDLAKADGLAIINEYEPLYGLTDPPPQGTELLPEWIASDAVLIAWYAPFAEYFDALVTALTPYSKVWILTADEGETAMLKARWTSFGISLEQLSFFEYRHEAFWTRDFGPWSVKLPNGQIGYIDTKYYPTRYLDDAVPTLLAEYFQLPAFRPKLSAEGGNLMVNGAGLCVTTTRLAYNNPPKRSFEIHDLLRDWLGCEQTHFLEPLDRERTGHVDLFAKFTQADTLVLGQYDEISDPENAARMDRNAERLAKVRLQDGRPLKILRMPMPPTQPNLFRTYTNALTVNNTLIMPSYSEFSELERTALAVYREALPPGTIIEVVPADSVIEAGGAVHCTTMQVSILPTNWQRADADQPGTIAHPEGAIAQTPNLKWSAGETIKDTLTVEQSDKILGEVEIAIRIEHRAQDTLRVRVSHGDRSVQVELTNDASPINERRIVTDAFADEPHNGVWEVEIENDRFNFSGALLEWWIRPF